MYYTRYKPTFNLAQVDPGVVTATGNVVGGAEMEVRVGYFGICIQPDGGSYICNSNATALAEVVTVDQDPLNLIWVASTFKDAVVFPYLLYVFSFRFGFSFFVSLLTLLSIIAVILAFFCFILLATFPGWHEEVDASGSEKEVKPFPSRPVSQAALALIFVSSVFILVSVLWQHTASVAASTVAQDMGNGSVKSGVGSSAMVLGWFGFALMVVVTIGLLVMILSIRLIRQLTDEEE